MDVRNKMAQLLKHQDVLAALLDRISENQRSAASLMQNDEQPEKDSERKVSVFSVCITVRNTYIILRKKLIE
jgi:hypothetical protein